MRSTAERRGRERRDDATARRRAAILDAALACFEAKGVVATTMEDIRLAAGVSVGSLYHHFPSKDAIAAALYVELIGRYQREAASTVTDDLSPRRWIRAAIEHHARWSIENPTATRFLLAHREPEVHSLSSRQVAELNSDLESRVSRWLDKHVEAGRIRTMRPDAFIAVVIGPVHQFVRHWAFRPSSTPPNDVVEALTDAAWRAVRAPRREGARSGAQAIGAGSRTSSEVKPRKKVVRATRKEER